MTSLTLKQFVEDLSEPNTHSIISDLLQTQPVPSGSANNVKERKNSKYNNIVAETTQFVKTMNNLQTEGNGSLAKMGDTMSDLKKTLNESLDKVEQM
eukprot:TRINITY_DN12573_c0_g1_i1.p1 TRINITY_DN12573_c0_g1~~TRINITY_DN12573_c0_g1_i1.p1  ORF type:complete len:114 (-),score=40.43 TRINITY_DN12573_c0_g1_i1:165-455(-)